MQARAGFTRPAMPPPPRSRAGPEKGTFTWGALSEQEKLPCSHVRFENFKSEWIGKWDPKRSDEAIELPARRRELPRNSESRCEVQYADCRVSEFRWKTPVPNCPAAWGRPSPQGAAIAELHSKPGSDPDGAQLREEVLGTPSRRASRRKVGKRGPGPRRSRTIIPPTRFSEGRNGDRCLACVQGRSSRTPPWGG